MRTAISFVCGIVTTVVLTAWVGLEFWSWQFWGPFLTLTITESLACVLYAEAAR